MSVEPSFPEFVEPPAGADAAQVQDVFGSWLAPEHAGLFTAGANPRLTAGFNDL